MTPPWMQRRAVWFTGALYVPRKLLPGPRSPTTMAVFGTIMQCAAAAAKLERQAVTNASCVSRSSSVEPELLLKSRAMLFRILPTARNVRSAAEAMLTHESATSSSESN